jgi:hypothetical protein
VDLVRLTSIHTRSNQQLALSIPCHPEVCIDDCADIAGALSVETQSADGFHPLPLSLSLFFSLYISALSISLFPSIYLSTECVISSVTLLHMLVDPLFGVIEGSS